MEEKTMANDEFKELWSRFTRTQEKERSDLARELHDQVGQMLVALGLNLTLIRNQLPDDTDPSLSARIVDSLEQLKKMNARVRDVMGGLRPPALDDFGLSAALKWYAEQYSTRTGIIVDVSSEVEGVRLPDDVETALFRVAQEAMTNIVKHAQAKTISVTCVAVQKAYRLTISDDGVGFDTRAKVARGNGGGWGLVTMRERVRDVGGKFAVNSTVGGGTQVVVELEDVL